ncbi:hypothetical protein cje11_02932 [Campylobacter jejuni subsp. jejuni 60004]|nr:hypothetical protein M635_05740 [Campylobacter jejuni 32488]AHK52798.1 hypothetical protein N916_01405 [Campylobacter jejuni subsp. jejuni NCTC 11168-K12E5]AHK54463.1 hypothetical protein N919_01405 [Campylobacter jejuni subsp. jejuni NCTC 11168-Kf1]AHK56129.1 hypothetical protein N917_01405 [Campylobacter jejuni subsp. jejuni NCTC 11168-mcK12E5]AHK57794.1 hypothetical protein N918_01405 [Campylobacter jejuni subsp. jejuni NCTC 11168-mfK12E5]AHK59459.1 hypothetical protein N920_01405 [Campy
MLINSYNVTKILLKSNFCLVFLQAKVKIVIDASF